MRSECFLDTNILIYAAAGRRDDPTKHAIASGIILDGQFCLSGQVLAEFYFNMRRKFHKTVSLSETHRWLEQLAEFPVVAVDSALVLSAVALAERYRISYWDAALVAASERLGTPVLYTEDLNHGQKYGSVVAINPFRPD